MATRTETRTASNRRLLNLTGATVMLGLAAGLGSWQIGLHLHSHQVVATVSQPIALTAAGPQQAASLSNAAPAPVLALPAAADASRRDTLVLVGSNEQATTVAEQLDAARRAAPGLDLPEQFMVVAGPETEARSFLPLLEAENAQRAVQGLLPIQVEDLR